MRFAKFKKRPFFLLWTQTSNSCISVAFGLIQKWWILKMKLRQWTLCSWQFHVCQSGNLRSLSLQATLIKFRRISRELFCALAGTIESKRCALQSENRKNMTKAKVRSILFRIKTLKNEFLKLQHFGIFSWHFCIHSLPIFLRF